MHAVPGWHVRLRCPAHRATGRSDVNKTESTMSFHLCTISTEDSRSQNLEWPGYIR